MTVGYDPQELSYTATHEWVCIEGNLVTVGLTDFAQDNLSDVVWVELPEEESTFEVGQVMATVESVKAAGDIYAPVSGTVIEINKVLTASPELVNSQPYASWFCRIRISGEADLPVFLSPEEYIQSTLAD